MKRNILISSPSTYEDYVFLPLVWGLLRAAAEEDPGLKERFHWLDPIADNTGLEPANIVSLPEVDVLGISNVMWNASLNHKLAAQLKAKNPSCMVVAGGPHNDWEDPDYFKKHPWVDVVVMGEGEEAFKNLLLFRDQRDRWKEIPGLILGPNAQKTAPIARLKQFRSDIYNLYPEYYSQLIAKWRKKNALVLSPIETDRGCPFQCTFCDWGSNINARIREGKRDEIARAIAWISKNGVDVAHITAANFGMTGEHVTASELLRAGNSQFGYPKQVHFNLTKTSTPNSAKISEMLYGAGMIPYMTLSLQTTTAAALAAVRRKGMRIMPTLMKELQEKNIPLAAELVMGLPGETTAGFVQTVDDLGAQGIYHFFMYPFSILPNAEANTPAYRALWRIESVKRAAFVSHRKLEGGLTAVTELSVSTSTYSREDYAYMLTLSTLVSVFLKFGLLRPLSVYLKNEKDVPASTISKRILDRAILPGARGLLAEKIRPIFEHWRLFVGLEESSETIMEEMHPLALGSKLERLEFMPYPEELLAFALLENKELFFEEMRRLLEPELQTWPEIASLLLFNSDLLIDPSYDSRKGGTIISDYDWMGYFRATDWGQFPARRIPLEKSPIHFHASDSVSWLRQHLRLDWHRASSEEERAALFFWAIIPTRFDDFPLMYFRNLKPAESLAAISSYSEQFAR